MSPILNLKNKIQPVFQNINRLDSKLIILILCVIFFLFKPLILKLFTPESTMTLIVGLFAFILYKFESNEKKQSAIKIVSAEIRYAKKEIEKTRSEIADKDPQEKVRIIKNIVSNNFPEKLTNSRWEEYKHYFVKDISEEKLDNINNFYLVCSIIDEQTLMIRKSFYVPAEQKMSISQQELLNLFKEHYDRDKKIEVLEKEVRKKIEEYIDPFLRMSWSVEPTYILNRLISNIEKIDLSDATDLNFKN